MNIETKKCGGNGKVGCGKDKPLTEFYKDKQTSDGYTFKCKECNVKKVVEYQKNNRIKIKFNHIKNETGVTKENYMELLRLQNSKCAICNVDVKENNKNLSIDHCHDTNIVRGLLCSRCNLGLGYFFDNAEMLKKAIQYLKKNYSKLGIEYKGSKRTKKVVDKRKYEKVKLSHTKLFKDKRIKG